MQIAATMEQVNMFFTSIAGEIQQYIDNYLFQLLRQLQKL